MAIQERIYTADDLWDLSHRPENDGKRFELHEGVLIEMAPAGAKHGGVGIRLGRYVDEFVDEHELGYVTAAETGYILHHNPNGRDTVLAPDVGFISFERHPDDLPDKYVPLAPDLAIEIASPNDTGEEIQEKIQTYLRYGVRTVVYVYPKPRVVTVDSPRGRQTLTEEDTLDLSDVLPGFKLPLHKLFNLRKRK